MVSQEQERAVSTSPSSQNVPSLDEAHRVVTYVLDDELKRLAGQLDGDQPSADTLRGMVALTVAVVGATESLYSAVGREHPENWESLERSAAVFMNQHVVKWLAQNDPHVRRAVQSQRRRKLAARAGTLQLVESDRNKRTRWAAVVLPKDAPIPVSEDKLEGLAELVDDAEGRLFEHLSAVPSNDMLTMCGQIVGLMSAAECLLALFPSNKLAAFCVQLAVMSNAAASKRP